MHNSKTWWLSVVYLTAATLFFAACESDGSGIGAEVLPEEDLIALSFSDTSTVLLETQVLDSINTYRATDLLFGNYADPVFGRIKATTNLEFVARSGLEFGAPDDLVLDSVILSLQIIDAYGRLDLDQELEIFELNEIVPRDEEANSNKVLAHKGVDLANGYSFSYDSARQAKLLFISLKKEFGQRFFDEGSGNLGSSETFRNFFNGLAISTKEVPFLNREPGAIFSMDVLIGTSFLSFYYKKRNASGNFETQTPEPFRITSSTPRYSTLQRTETTGTLLERGTTQVDLMDQLEFVQAGAFVRTFVKFPHLDKLPLVAISRAELVLSVDTTLTGSNGVFTPPAQLEPFLADSDGAVLIDEFGFPVDVELNRLASSVAPYDASEGIYNFDFTGYVQRIISEQQDNNGFFIFPSARNFTVNRVVFGGVDHPTLTAKLNITYSSLPR